MNRWLAWLCIAISVGSDVVYADWSGFGTLATSHFSNPYADFAYNNHATGPGRSRAYDVALDSNVGLQWQGKNESGVMATVQGVVYRDARNLMTPSLTMANISLPVNESLQVRIGRTQNPNFLYSNYRHVNFALPWLRPPREVYGITSFFNYDGVQVDIKRPLSSGWQYNVMAGAAGSNVDYSFDAGSHINQASSNPLQYVCLGLSDNIWTVKLSYEQGRLTSHEPNSDSLLLLLRQSDTNLADTLALDQKDYRFAALGLSYDTDNWLWVSEFAWRHVDAFLGERRGVYSTLAKTIGAWTPYISWAKTWRDSPNVSNPLAQRLTQSVSYSATSWTLGASYALSANVILKGELEQIVLDAGSRLAYVNYDVLHYPYNNPGRDLLVSAGVSWVF